MKKAALFLYISMVMTSAARARARRTDLLASNPAEFERQLTEDILQLLGRANRAKLPLFIRLNGTSDLFWPNLFPNIFRTFWSVQFFDYTKRADLFESYERLQKNGWPANYHLTYSRTGPDNEYCTKILANNRNVAIVFPAKEPLPAEWNGFPVIDGDLHDARPVDGSGKVVGLRAKGKARRLQSGPTRFVYSET